MQILSKNFLIQETLKNQNAWLIKFTLKKYADISSVRYNKLVVPEYTKIFSEEVLSEAEIRVLYEEEFIIKKFEKYFLNYATTIIFYYYLATIYYYYY